jgi:hypothetical protein
VARLASSDGRVCRGRTPSFAVETPLNYNCRFGVRERDHWLVIVLEDVGANSSDWRPSRRRGLSDR